MFVHKHNAQRMYVLEISVASCRNLPMVGTVHKTSPTCRRYRIVVLPAASSPSITTYIGRFIRANRSAVCSNGDGLLLLPSLLSGRNCRRRASSEIGPFLASVLFVPLHGFRRLLPRSSLSSAVPASLNADFRAFCAACGSCSDCVAGFSFSVIRDDLRNVECRAVTCC